MNLSKRILAIIAACPPYELWADIGADHGFTSAGLLREKKAGRVIATDVSADSLSKAEALAKELALEDRMLLRVGDGLAPVKDAGAQGAVISGMGAPLMISILEAQRDTAALFGHMVLSPNNYPERLRKYLNENGFAILSERMVEDKGRFYPVMLVCPGGEPPYSKGELLLGRNVQKDDDFSRYVQYKYNVWTKIKRDTGEKNAHAHEMLTLYSDALKRL